MYTPGLFVRSAATGGGGGGAPVDNEVFLHDPNVDTPGQTDFPLPAAAQSVLDFSVGGLSKDEPDEWIVLGSPGSLVVRWTNTASVGGFDLDVDDDIAILYKT